MMKIWHTINSARQRSPSGVPQHTSNQTQRHSEPKESLLKLLSINMSPMKKLPTALSARDSTLSENSILMSAQKQLQNAPAQFLSKQPKPNSKTAVSWEARTHSTREQESKAISATVLLKEIRTSSLVTATSCLKTVRFTGLAILKPLQADTLRLPAQAQKARATFSTIVSFLLK